VNEEEREIEPLVKGRRAKRLGCDGDAGDDASDVRDEGGIEVVVARRGTGSLESWTSEKSELRLEVSLEAIS